MSHPVLYLGVDVAKLVLDFDLPKPHHHVANTSAAISAVLRALPPGTQLVCEATGGYEAKLVAAALAADVPISVVAPQRVRHHALSEGRLAKTDRLDAALLSAYGRGHRPAATTAPCAGRIRLRELLRARTQLLELQKLESNWQEHPAGQETLRAQARERSALLTRQLAALDAAIRREVASGPAAQPCARLQQVQGVGEITAWTVWAELPELGHLAPGQPGALAGLAPHPRDSGGRSAKRFIQHGRSHLRRVLYMAALSAAHHNPVLKRFYANLRARGKPARLALIAVARRLIELLNLILKKPHFLLSC